jgi:hypothetical protein
MGEYCIVPCPTGDNYTALSSVPLELARQRKVMGTVYRKHILNEGVLIHPKTKQRISVDGSFMDSLVHNFNAGIGDIVQVPLANDKNEHVESPGANLGEVVGLERKDRKLYALIDARQDAEKFGKTYLGASAFLSTDYTDTSTDRKAGPTLLHVAVTNRPYVTNLEDYEQVVAATADDESDEAVVLTLEEGTMDREQMIAALKADHGIDVEALQAQASRGGDVSALTAALTQALGGDGNLALTNGITGEDIVGAVAELAQLSNTQAERIGSLERDKAETRVEGYISQGRLLPKAKDRAIEMVLSNDEDGLKAFLAPVNDPYVKLAAPRGVPGDTSEGHVEDVDAELARLTAKDGPNAHLFS